MLFISIITAFIGFIPSIHSIQKDDSPPNVIILLADDLGYNDLSCYRTVYTTRPDHEPTTRTPNLDQLARQGMVFTQFYAGAAVCSPSRSALITGRNKTRLGIYNWIPPANNPMHLRGSEVTIAEMLKQRNYATAHFGKWHLTSDNMNQPEPLDQGFDYAFWTFNNAHPSHKNPDNFIRNREPVGELQGYSSHLVIGEAMQWLTEREDSNQPFYMNLWFHESHVPEAAPDSLKNRHEKLPAYYGCIENMDYAIGDLISFLREKELYDNTIIIFTSDNGSQYLGSNDPLRGQKAYQYEGGIRVPFIVHAPRWVPAATNTQTVGHFTDVLPTLATLTQTQPPAGVKIDGEDLSEVWLGRIKKRERKNPLFFYRYFHDPICMLREGDLILLGYLNQPHPWQESYNTREDALFKPEPGEPRWAQWGFQEGHMEAIPNQKPRYFELYNIKTDVAQRTDITGHHPKKVEKMKRTMLNLREEMLEEGGKWYE